MTWHALEDVLGEALDAVRSSRERVVLVRHYEEGESLVLSSSDTEPLRRLLARAQELRDSGASVEVVGQDAVSGAFLWTTLQEE